MLFLRRQSWSDGVESKRSISPVVRKLLTMASVLRYFFKVIQKLRSWINTCHKETISCTSTRDVKQVPFSVEDIFQIRIVGSRLNPFLKRNYFVVARHDCDRTKFE